MRFEIRDKGALKRLRRRLGPERERRNADILRKVVLQAHADAITLSPVDTGFYRGNHAVSLGAPLAAPIGERPPEGAADAGQAAGRVAEARSTLSRSAVRAAIAGRTPLFISNAVPYAGRIEDGHSKQAPAGVYQVVRQRIPEYVRAAQEEAARGQR